MTGEPKSTTFRIGRAALLLVALGVASLSWAETPKPRLPADEPRRGDPDLTRVQDERLKELYLSTMVGIRTPELTARMPDGALPRDKYLGLIEAFVIQPKDDADIEYIVQAGLDALAQNPQDWPTYRCALWATKAGMRGDSRFVPVAEFALAAPRGVKLSDSHGAAILDTLRTISVYDTQEAAALATECTSEEFWGPTPIRTRKISEKPSNALSIVRQNALKALSEMDPGLSIPALEELAEEYPNLGPAMHSESKGIDTLREGFGYSVRKRLWRVKTRAGLPAGPNPQDEYRGLRMEEKAALVMEKKRQYDATHREE